MEYVTGIRETKEKELDELMSGALSGQEVSVKGAVHVIRDMGEISFVILRKSRGTLQCLFTKERFSEIRMHEGMTVRVTGILNPESRAPGGFELEATEAEILSAPAPDTAMPLPIGKWKMNTSLETRLSLRPISLRNLRERAVFKIQEGIVRGFRDFLYQEHFTEIRTPKIVAGNAEGGANVFRLEYFGKKAFFTSYINREAG